MPATAYLHLRVDECHEPGFLGQVKDSVVCVLESNPRLTYRLSLGSHVFG